MPAQSGDPISSALQVSLANNNSKKEEKDVSLLLSYSAKQILLSEIKYEEFNYDSTSFLNSLKSKYTLISEKDNESTDCDNTSKQSSNFSQNSSVKSILSTSNNSERVKSVDRVNSHNDRTENRSSKPSLPTPSRTLWPQDAVSLGWKTNTPVGGGFINLWNSCYINSTLQALFHIPGFVNWLLMENSHKCPSKSSTECLICAMTQTLKNSQESTGKAIKPYLIYSRLKSICKHLYPGAQEDAHEFLRHLVDSLDRTYLMPFKDLRLDHLSKETTPLSQIFGGYLRNEVVCQACGHISTTFQYFQDLPLDIANSSHLDGALDMFFARESVSEHEGYKCEHCKRRVPFTKKFSLEKAPRVLCVQLKRFGVVSGKNNKSISIAGKLNLNRFRAVKNGDCFEPYYLAAVVNHIGTSASCGHYTAIAMAADNKFYLFDDQRVERLHDLAQNSSQAYILLYHQKPNVPNGVKPDLPSKLSNINCMKTNSVLASSASHESAKERLFGKNESNSKNPFKIFNNSIMKVTTSVGNSISNILTKVNGNGVSSSDNGENNTEKTNSHGSSSPKKSEGSNVRSDFIGPLKPDNTPEKVKKSETSNETNSKEHFSTSRLQNGHTSDNNTSLVPYNESSCSSDDGSLKAEESRPSTPNKQQLCNNDPGPPPNKRPRFDSISRDPTDTRKVQTNGTSDKNGASPSYNRLSNGHSSPGKSKFSNGNSNNGGMTYGKYNRGWTVTSRSPSTSPSKSTEPPKHNWKVKGLDDGRNDYKSQLMSMGHRGYGKPVLSWSGDKSEMEKEVNRDNYMHAHRLSSSYNDKYDMPSKKIKKYHGGGGGSNYDNKKRFNEAQKRKNNWYGKSNIARQNYYPGDSRQRNGESFYNNKYRPWSHI